MLCLGIDQYRKQLTVEDRNENGDRTVRRQMSTKWDSVRTILQEYFQRALAEGALGQLRTRTINRNKHSLRKYNLEQECPTKGLDTSQGGNG